MRWRWVSDAESDEMGVRFTILGPVEVSVAGRHLPRVAPRHRGVLAYLLLHSRTVVSVDRLIGAIWGQTPPKTARAQVHAAVTGIRRVLREAGAEQLLVTRAAGYVVVPEPGQLDLDEFAGQVAAAAEQAAGDDPSAAAEQLHAALALWHGEALAGVSADYVPQARARLAEQRMTAFERLADLELSLGRHDDLIDELAAQVTAHPLRQRLSGQLMLALHRAGRQADALSVARAFRASLVDRQGLDPGRDFVTLEQAILRDDPSLHHRRIASAEPAPDARPGDAAPRQQPRPACFLPHDTPDFAGRTDELDRLTGALEEAGGVVTISAIDGMAGIGKTALAIHAGHRLAERFPDGQLFIDLLAHTVGQTPVEPGAALEILLRQLDVPAERIPASPTDRAALWRSELANRRVLVVLDNAADTDRVRPLLPGASESLVLITSRRRLTDLDGAHVLSLDPLLARDAVDLFTRIVGERAVAESIAVLDVLQLCGFLPLGVRIAAARMLHRPQWTVEYLANRLRDQRRRLTELSTGERGVAAAFTLSYQQLDPDQQRMFRLLGLLPGRDIDASSAAALAHLPVERAELLLEDLLDAHVMLQHEPGRYTFHDLLREHASATASAAETEVARHDAITRLLDHYLYTACTAVDLLYPNVRRHESGIAPPGIPAIRFDGAAEAAAWLDAERANLIAAGTYAADHDWPSHTGQLATTLFRYLYDQAHDADALSLHTQALRASRRRGDQAAEARALIDLCTTHWRQGRYEQATEQFRNALELSRRIGDRSGESRAWHRLGVAFQGQRDDAVAHKHPQPSPKVSPEAAELISETNTLGNLGLAYERQGRYVQAADHFRQALDRYRELGTRGGEATALVNLGLVHQRQGQFEQASDHLRRALDVYRDLGYLRDQAETLNCLGEVARSMGDPATAVDDHAAALGLARELGNRPAQARAHDGLAHAHRDLGRAGVAREHAELALDLYTRLAMCEADGIRGFLAGLD